MEICNLACANYTQKWFIITNFMEQTPWQANNRLNVVEFFLTYVTTENSLPCWKQPVTGSYPEPAEFTQYPRVHINE
jgi:hypothetical protein